MLLGAPWCGKRELRVARLGQGPALWPGSGPLTGRGRLKQSVGVREEHVSRGGCVVGRVLSGPPEACPFLLAFICP